MKRLVAAWGTDLLVVLGILLVAGGLAIVHPTLALVWSGLALIGTVGLGGRR